MVENEMLEIAGTYSRVSGTGFPVGTWKFASAQVRFPEKVVAAFRDSVNRKLAMDLVIYGDETLIVDSTMFGWAYKHIHIYDLAAFAYGHRNDSKGSVKYIGRDSAEVRYDGEIIGIKYSPYERFVATSNRPRGGFPVARPHAFLIRNP